MFEHKSVISHQSIFSWVMQPCLTKNLLQLQQSLVCWSWMCNKVQILSGWSQSLQFCLSMVFLSMNIWKQIKTFELSFVVTCRNRFGEGFLVKTCEWSPAVGDHSWSTNLLHHGGWPALCLGREEEQFLPFSRSEVCLCGRQINVMVSLTAPTSGSAGWLWIETVQKLVHLQISCGSQSEKSSCFLRK